MIIGGKVVFEAEYHDGKIILIQNGMAEQLINIDSDNQETVLVDAARDQWGVWLSFNEIVLGQEDETRSFLDAYIKGLRILRKNNEHKTLPAKLQNTAVYNRQTPALT